MLKVERILFLIICITVIIAPIFSEDISDSITDNEYFSDYVYMVIELIEENIQPLEETSNGTYDDGTVFTVYTVSDNIKLTVSIDENETRYIVGNVDSLETMQEIIDLLSNIFSEPVPYLNSIVKDYKAAFYDSGNYYINNDLTDYLGTFTILGSQMFVEEVRTQEKLIIQKQWCTLEYFDQCAQELGTDWGFLASWDPEPQSILSISLSPVNEQLLSEDDFISYIVKPGDYLAKIAHEYYGTGYLWGLIYELNKDTLPVRDQPNLIFPDIQLRMPSIEYINDLINFAQNN